MIIEILKWVGIIILVLLALGIVLVTVLVIVSIIRILSEPDKCTVPVCALNNAPCSAPEGTSCSCCDRYRCYEEQEKLS